MCIVERPFTILKFKLTVVFISLCGQVSVGRVESLCPEKDCTANVIKVVNPTTGECVTCFPCHDLCSVGVPSVRCGSTVPNGTQMHCVQSRPTPKLVSPSGILWSASWSAASSITHSVVVHASRSKNFVRSSSSALYSHFTPEKPRKEKEFPLDRPIQGSNTSVYKFGATFLTITLVLIACKCWKIRSKQPHIPAINRYTNSKQEPSTIASFEQDCDTCTAHPETNSAVYSLGSVSSRECLDAPAILATFTAGRTGLVTV